MEWFMAFAQAFFALLVKKPLVLIFLGGSALLFLYCLGPLLDQMKYERAMIRAADAKVLEDLKQTAQPMDNKKTTSTTLEEKKMASDSVKTGDIDNSGNAGIIQMSIDSPGSSQVVNQQRMIRPEVNVEKIQRDNRHTLRVTLNQTSGLWDQGTKFQIEAAFTGSYESATIVKGLPPAQFDVQIGENKTAGTYFYSTVTAPYPNSPIVLEVVSEQDIGLKQLNVAPLASR